MPQKQPPARTAVSVFGAAAAGLAERRARRSASFLMPRDLMLET